MTNQEQPSLDSWDDFTGNWLKAEHFVKFPDETFVSNVKSDVTDDGKGIVILDLQYNGRKWKKQLNMTDIAKLKELGIKSPKVLVNHAVIWEKVRVYNPNTKKHVDSITIKSFRE